MANASVRVEGIKEILHSSMQFRAFMANPEMALRKTATILLGSFTRNFVEGGRPDKWKKLSPITPMLNKTLRGKKKIASWDDARAIADSVVPLRDSSALVLSLSPNKHTTEGAIYNIGKQSVEVGSSLPYASTQQNGGKVPFKWDAETQRRFKKNVAKPKKGKRGQVSGAFYYQMQNHFEKRDGTSSDIPARPFIVVRQDDLDNIEKVWIEEAKKFFNR